MENLQRFKKVKRKFHNHFDFMYTDYDVIDAMCIDSLDEVEALILTYEETLNKINSLMGFYRNIIEQENYNEN